MNTEQGNKLIAEFMGYRINKGRKHEVVVSGPINAPIVLYRVEKLIYHTSWSWLMPVVEKIEALEGGDLFSIFIVGNKAEMALSSKYNDEGEDWDAPRMRGDEETKILSTWTACVQFIQWYNSLTPSHSGETKDKV